MLLVLEATLDHLPVGAIVGIAQAFHNCEFKAVLNPDFIGMESDTTTQFMGLKGSLLGYAVSDVCYPGLTRHQRGILGAEDRVLLVRVTVP